MAAESLKWEPLHCAEQCLILSLSGYYIERQPDEWCDGSIPEMHRDDGLVFSAHKGSVAGAACDHRNLGEFKTFGEAVEAIRVYVIKETEYLKYWLEVQRKALERVKELGELAEEPVG